MPRHPECQRLWDRADRVLAGGPATLSKHPSRGPYGVAPLVLDDGDGAYVWCADGQRYVDTVAALGPILLGHSNPDVTAAVRAQAGRLTSASLLTRLEGEAAEKLCSIIPGAEMCRFMKNGSDATNAAIRLARAITGKRHVICSGYHGANYDWYAITTEKHAGILPHNTLYSHQVPWGDKEAFTEACAISGNDLAAIIVEVPPFSWNGQDSSIDAETSAIMYYQNAARVHHAIFAPHTTTPALPTTRLAVILGDGALPPMLGRSCTESAVRAINKH